jgi:hypothetical protein
MKGTMTNFDMTEYEKDIAWLTNIAQVRGARVGLCGLHVGNASTDVCVLHRGVANPTCPARCRTNPCLLCCHTTHSNCQAAC